MLVLIPTNGRSVALNKKHTTKTQIVKEKTLIATVDISKSKHMGCYRCPDGSEVKPFEFPNNRTGFDQFWGRISKAMKTHHLKDVVFGFESTGPYAEPLIHYLRRKPVRLVQVNPMHSKRVKELQGNSPNKTDRKDPKVIADIIELGHALSLIIPEGSAAELRRLSQARERSIKRRTALFNQLQHIVCLVFPEFLDLMKDIKTKSALYLLRNFPTPQSVLEYDMESMIDTLRKISRGKVGRKRIETLYALAKHTIGIDQGQEGLAFEITGILQIIDVTNCFIADLEKKMSGHLKQIPYRRSLLSIKGIGEVSAAGLIGEVGDFRQYKTISEITKLAGLDLFEISSGKRQGNRRISKRGRPYFRKILYCMAVHIVCPVGIMRQSYQHYLDRGMLKKKALVAIARKLLRIIFALVRNQSEYVHGYTKHQGVLKEAA